MPEKITSLQAREQAAEATGFLDGYILVVGGQEYEIPQRGLLDDDARERLNELDLETETWDRDDDILFASVETVAVIADVLRENPDVSTEELRQEVAKKIADAVAAADNFNKRPGPLKVPYRKNNELIKPPYQVQVAMAVLGDEYEKFKAAGGRASDVTATLARLDRKVEEREASDPKSVGSDSEVASTADGN